MKKIGQFNSSMSILQNPQMVESNEEVAQGGEGGKKYFLAAEKGGDY